MQQSWSYLETDRCVLRGDLASDNLINIESYYYHRPRILLSRETKTKGGIYEGHVASLHAFPQFEEITHLDKQTSKF